MIRGNVGGVFLWQSACAKLDAVNLEGGSSYVILADQGGMPTLTVRSCNMFQSNACHVLETCPLPAPKATVLWFCGRAAEWRAAYMPRTRRGRVPGKTAMS